MTVAVMTKKPAPVAKSKPTKEQVRQMVLADQATALKEAAKPEKTKPAAEAPKAKERKADTRRITVLAKSNPHEKGSKRAKWFGLLKTGMTVDEAVKAGVRSVYIHRMVGAKVLKIG